MINKINKKAQTGRILTAFPVLIIIVLIMAAFIILSIGIAKFKAPEAKKAFGVVDGNTLPLETINVKVGNEIKSMWVLDAALGFIKGEITSKAIYDSGAIGMLTIAKEGERGFLTMRLRPVSALDANSGNLLYVQCDNRGSKLCYYSIGQVSDYDNAGLLNSVYFEDKGMKYVLESYYGNERIATTQKGTK